MLTTADVQCLANAIPACLGLRTVCLADTDLGNPHGRLVARVAAVKKLARSLQKLPNLTVLDVSGNKKKKDRQKERKKERERERERKKEKERKRKKKTPG